MNEITRSRHRFFEGIVALRARSAARLLVFLIVLFPAVAMAQTLPAGWTSADVGSPVIPGTATYSSGTYSVTGAGADIWGTADQFTFVYRQLTGDGSVVARVSSVQSIDAWSKAGVMVRES